MIPMEQHYEKHSDCMLAKSPQWEIELRGWVSNGMGDLIYRNANFAMAHDDVELLLMGRGLLKEYKRWPDWMEPGKKLRRELVKKGYRRMRGQRSMTRDPYIMTLAAISLWPDLTQGTKEHWLKELRIPFWMNRRWLWLYKKALLDPAYTYRFERVMLRQMKRREAQQPRRLVWKEKKQQAKDDGNRFKEYIYDALQKILGYPGYVKYLHGWMAYTVQAKGMQEQLARLTPHWNYAVLLLCEKPTMRLAEPFIVNYKAKKGFQWASDTWVSDENKLLPPTDKYKLDKDILDYLWARHKAKHIKPAAHSYPLKFN